MTDSIAYREAGVDIAEGERAVELMKARVKQTFGPEVMTGLGGFGGLFKPNLTGIKTPVLVSGTDGVGTKIRLAILADKHDTIGIDLVAMCANDVLCQGAKPLFFLDYIAAGKIKAEKIESIVSGVAEGCLQAGCALIGGETAEMPGIYSDDDYDLAGFCVGIVDEDDIVDGSGVAEGDVLIGLRSSGFHSNGYSLVRKIFLEDCKFDIFDSVEGLDVSIGEALLEPTRIYANQVETVMNTVKPQAMLHVTGGGFHGNIPRVLPDGLGAVISLGSWELPKVFEIISDLGSLKRDDLFTTFNMGIGYIFIVREDDAEAAMKALDAIDEVGASIIGRVEKGSGVKFID